jgi:hypothetical protein
MILAVSICQLGEKFRFDDDRLVLGAYFIPHGVWGRLYHLLVPLHFLVFRKRIRSVLAGAAPIKKGS